MAGKGKVRDAGLERRWRRLVRSWAKNGCSVREFCRREKVRESAFYYWRRELERREGKSKGPRSSGVFVPVPLAAEAVGSMEVRLRSGQVLRLGAAFDPGRVAELVRLLEG